MKHLTLQTNLKFTADDLKSNRVGRVSKRQFENYKPRYLTWAVMLRESFTVSAIAPIKAQPFVFLV